MWKRFLQVVCLATMTLVQREAAAEFSLLEQNGWKLTLDGRLNAFISVAQGDRTPEGVAEWTRTVARTVAGSPERSPFFRVTQGRKVNVKLDRKVPYELDGGARSKVKSYRLAVEPGAITVRVPVSTNGNGGGRS